METYRCPFAYLLKAARFGARKTLEEFDFTFQRSVKKTVVEHLGQLALKGDSYRLRDKDLGPPPAEIG